MNSPLYNTLYYHPQNAFGGRRGWSSTPPSPPCWPWCGPSSWWGPSMQRRTLCPCRQERTLSIQPPWTLSSMRRAGRMVSMRKHYSHPVYPGRCLEWWSSYSGSKTQHMWPRHSSGQYLERLAQHKHSIQISYNVYLSSSAWDLFSGQPFRLSSLITESRKCVVLPRIQILSILKLPILCGNFQLKRVICTNNLPYIGTYHAI